LAEGAPFTVEQFYKFIGEKKLMGARCNRCGAVLIPPKPICPSCSSREFTWIELDNRGKLATYTIIHVAPAQFQSVAPYAFGIIELKDGLRLPGMIRGLEPEKVKVGMELEVDFDTSVPSTWPQWSRYFFRPP